MLRSGRCPGLRLEQFSFPLRRYHMAGIPAKDRPISFRRRRGGHADRVTACRPHARTHRWTHLTLSRRERLALLRRRPYNGHPIQAKTRPLPSRTGLYEGRNAGPTIRGTDRRSRAGSASRWPRMALAYRYSALNTGFPGLDTALMEGFASDLPNYSAGPGERGNVIVWD